MTRHNFNIRSLLILLAITVGIPTAALAAVEPPSPVRTIAPEYPPDLKDEGVSGVVTLLVTIEENGTVSDVSVTKSTHKDFEEPAVTAIKQWKFKPGKRDGVPAKMQVTIPMKFTA